MILTIAKLRKLGACENALARLEATFGTGPVEVTEALCVAHAHASGYNWDWAPLNLLEPDAQAEFCRIATRAWDEFYRIIAPAMADDRLLAAREERDRSIAAAFGKLAEAQP